MVSARTLRLLLRHTDADAVAVVVSEWLHSVAHSLSRDARLRDVSLEKHVLDALHTLLAVALVDVGIACALIGIATHAHLLARILLKELDKLVQLGFLTVLNLCRAYVKEDLHLDILHLWLLHLWFLFHRLCFWDFLKQIQRREASCDASPLLLFNFIYHISLFLGTMVTRWFHYFLIILVALPSLTTMLTPLTSWLTFKPLIV